MIAFKTELLPELWVPTTTKRGSVNSGLFSTKLVSANSVFISLAILRIWLSDKFLTVLKA